MPYVWLICEESMWHAIQIKTNTNICLSLRWEIFKAQFKGNGVLLCVKIPFMQLQGNFALLAILETETENFIKRRNIK